MNITGIHSIVYGCDDLEAAGRFLSDLGFEPMDDDGAGPCAVKNLGERLLLGSDRFEVDLTACLLLPGARSTAFDRSSDVADRAIQIGAKAGFAFLVGARQHAVLLETLDEYLLRDEVHSPVLQSHVRLTVRKRQLVDKHVHRRILQRPQDL